MLRYAVDIAIQAAGPIPDAAYAAVAGALRPDDEALCVWIDEADRTRLLVSTDVSAVDVEAALASGRALSAETLTLFDMDARVAEVIAASEEELDQYSVWKPERR